jgi:hypothetical protein
MSARGVYQILRLPLFVTAVADVVAGYTVATLTRPHGDPLDWRLMLLLAGTSAGLYLFGMVENDLRDVRRDRLLKIPRPLVTGAMSVSGAVILLILTAALAAACASQLNGGAIFVTMATFAAINFYNLAAKFGPSPVCMTVMGLCRFLNFGIGVTAAIGFLQQPRPALLLPGGELWARQAVVLFFATAMISGYSICARHGFKVSTRPWQLVFIATIIGSIGMWMTANLLNTGGSAQTGDMAFHSRIFPPLARAVALVILPLLWPGGLFSPLGRERKPEEYGKFIERTIYWMILLDAAFVLDALLLRQGMMQ